MAYQNPGSAAVTAITDFMLKREQAKDRELARKHQSEMEKRQLDREERQAKAQEQELKFRQEQHEDAKKDKGYQRAEKRLDSMVPGDVPDAELIADSQKYGLGYRLATTQAPTPIPEGFEGPMNSTDTTTNIGTPAQREVIRKRDYITNLMSTMEQDSPERKALEYQNATGQAPPAGIFKLAGGDTQPLLRVDARGDKVEIFDKGVWAPLTGEPPKGAHWVQVQHAPASSSGGGDDASVLSDKAIDTMARMIGKGAPWPPMGNGNKAAANRTKIANRLANYDKDLDMFTTDGAGPDLATAGANFAAMKGSLVKVQATYAAANAFAETAEKNAALLKTIIKGLPDTGITWLNRPYRALSGAMGDTASQQKMTEFNAIRQSLQNEYSRLLTSPNLAGAVTNKAREEMSTILSDSATIPQIEAALTTLTKEAQNRRDSYKEEIETLKKGISGGGSGDSTEKPPPTTLPAGVVVKKRK